MAHVYIGGVFPLASACRYPRNERWQGPKFWVRQHAEVVYIVHARRTNLIGIGTTTDPKRQFFFIGRRDCTQIVPLAVIPGDVRLVSALHRRFAHLRVRDGWFAPAAEIYDVIERLASRTCESQPV